MPRRRRTLTPGETALWERVARTAAPLRPEEAPPPPVMPPSAPPAEDRPPKPHIRAKHAAQRPHPAPAAAPPAVAWADPDAAPPPPFDRRRSERLRRGKLEPEARLDLHGMGRDRAHRALVDFVLGSQAAGRRLVLVITGKGRPDRSDAVIPERTGILRHSVPRWLAAPPLTGRVLDVRPAHARHGGAGALYLHLRRSMR